MKDYKLALYGDILQHWEELEYKMSRKKFKI